MISMIGQGRVITNFALTHFNAAKHFSAKCQEIEEKNAGQPFGNFFEEIGIYCASSIISASSSLEALINELYLQPGPLQGAIPEFDTFFWGNDKIRGFERRPALEKYRKAVNLLGNVSLSKNDDPYRKAEKLIGFRNYLIHFKPLWDDQRRNESLEDALEGEFETSPYVEDTADFLAMQCMTSSATAWAVDSVIGFIRYFSLKSELDSKKLKAFHG